LWNQSNFFHRTNFKYLLPTISYRMLVFDEIIVDEKIPHIQFACDLPQCKGACCTLEGAGGAPLENDEIEIIETTIPTIIKYLSAKHQKELQKKNFYSGEMNSFTIESVNDRDCIFSYKENGVAKCSFERAYFKNEITFRKPISCQLFPIRIKDFGGPVLRYEKIPECTPALQRGNREQIQLSDFLRDALIRKFGEQWYQQFRLSCSSLQDSFAD